MLAADGAAVGGGATDGSFGVATAGGATDGAFGLGALAIGAAGAAEPATAMAAARTSSVEYETVRFSGDAAGALEAGALAAAAAAAGARAATGAGGASGPCCDGMYAIVCAFCFLVSGAAAAP